MMSIDDIRGETGTPQEVKVCEWCGEPLETSDKRVKYHLINSKGVHCKEEARREKTRIRKWRFNKQHSEISRKQNIEKLGTFDLPSYNIKDALTTTYLGRLILLDPWGKEYEEIHKLREKICVTSYNKGKKQKNTQQHKGVSPFDYDLFNITLLLENAGPCPVCGDTIQDKDITRCELICRNQDCEGKGGLVLRGTDYKTRYPDSPGNRMSFTSKDIAESQRAKQVGRDLSVQTIAWNKYYKGE